MTAENRLDTMVPWSVWLSSSSATSRRFFSFRSASVFSCVSFSSRERKPSTCAGGHLSLPTVAWRVLERVQRVCTSLFFVNIKDSPPSMLSLPAVWRHNRLSILSLHCAQIPSGRGEGCTWEPTLAHPIVHLKWTPTLVQPTKSQSHA